MSVEGIEYDAAIVSDPMNATVEMNTSEMMCMP